MLSLLNHDFSYLSNISEEKRLLLNKLGIFTIRDLIFFTPRTYKVKEYNPRLIDDTSNEKKEVIIQGQVSKVKILYNRPSTIEIKYIDDITIELIFYKIPKFVIGVLSIGKICIVEGLAKKVNKTRWQISHPSIVFNKQNIKLIEPIYRLTHGITNHILHSCITSALNIFFADIELENEHNLLAIQNNWPSIKQAIKTIHCITYEKDIFEKAETAIARLATDELISHQINLHTMHRLRKKEIIFHPADQLKAQVMQNIGFNLTQEQQRVLQTIETLQSKPQQMLSLLQGDVGSGKTIIAVLSMLNVVLSNKQAVLMAPTELLAQQHYNYIQKIVTNLDIECTYLSGKMTKLQRTHVINRISSGQTKIIIGTHALFQEKIIFHNLSYVIIDEQHRFGVMQRLALINKSEKPLDVLLISATPIPRSLMLALFGNITMLFLKNTISNRKKILTYTFPNSKQDKIYDFMNKIIALQQKVYWVCPLIEDQLNNKNTYTNINQRIQQINNHFPNLAVELHGKMHSAQKVEKMHQFTQDKHILVATTVVEVGINVPNATLIVIENAEKFGLAQLHQLRGRVGRSHMQSYCILLYDEKNLNPTSMQRLKIIKSAFDGLIIAKKDLEMRGAGDVIGTKQSGCPDFYFANKIEQNEETVQNVIDTYKNICKCSKATDFFRKLFNFDQRSLEC